MNKICSCCKQSPSYVYYGKTGLCRPCDNKYLDFMRQNMRNFEYIPEMKRYIIGAPVFVSMSQPASETWYKKVRKFFGKFNRGGAQ